MDPTALEKDASWLARFHAGDRAALEQCYRVHVSRALGAAERILSQIDAETVTHEVFYRLISRDEVRRSFVGGNLGAWISQVASNAAIDHLRRLKREVSADALEVDTARHDDEVEAKMLIDRFRAEHLPPKWKGVFEARFLRQLPQREAAVELGMRRSTLAYQEQQIRALLGEYLLGKEIP